MLKVIPIPAFQDNYIWLFHKAGSNQAFVVDPGDAEPVLEALKNTHLTLAGILITHHHADHTGGINDLLLHTDVPVYGPDSARIPQISHKLNEDDSIIIEGHRFVVLAIPGHTLDHIAYFHAGENESETPVLFCGDTLFSAGCGRIFEGDSAMMYNSLQKLAALPRETLVYCTHEYTLSNLNFALAVLPEDQALISKQREDSRVREQNRPTLPTTLAAELQSNPFLRCSERALKHSAEHYSGDTLDSPEQVFATLRQWKDRY